MHFGCNDVDSIVWYLTDSNEFTRDHVDILAKLWSVARECEDPAPISSMHDKLLGLANRVQNPSWDIPDKREMSASSNQKHN